MARIAMITIRYGEEINGGAEYHCRMLAERLANIHDITVLTTNTNKLDDTSSDFKIGESNLNGVKVYRFSTNKPQLKLAKQASKQSKTARKLRRMIYRAGLSSLLFKTFPIWNFKVDQEIELLRQHRFYSPSLLTHIEDNKEHYDAFVFFTYENPLTVLGSLIIPEKTILIPTAHMEGMLFRSINSLVFSKVRHIAFNTETEYQMCRTIFQQAMSPSSVVGIGVEIAEPAPFNFIKEKYQLKEPFLLYCGRITEVKINSFLDYFIKFRLETGLKVNLVLTGEVLIPKVEHPDISYIGYISESEKIALMKNSFAVVNPSKAESLSLLTLEALSLGKAVIANQEAEVMVEHEERSEGAVRCYADYASFKEILTDLLEHPLQLKDIEQKGKDYVGRNYNWDLIIRKFETILNEIN
ncbi:glycosyltransferase [Sphingobacterium sp. DK4209]|uniref:Glycosyltransferase n=1 Tax=Sphingobacterium zhuxiongii TaxID=2662364 RepID=A0A5Q0QDZ6_9SPHI|nr:MULTISPECIES: glycosyltransferase family 4 protein [unclassified Sphingobacterium]MVZ65408.1 glycosyltransferase [Sphingobacterium sp. DK4209]QGA27439.1 glycosyltransferase [Sphingobacterium sp. dk4302]